MKVYSKLTQARVMLQNSNLKKTGKGPNFSYFELKDFLQRVNEIFSELKLSSFTDINGTAPKLVIVDCEDDSIVEFKIPYAEFKGDEKRKLQAVQELGAEITYLTRYLWVQALNIIEPDTIDRDKTVQEDTKQESSQPVQQSQKSNIKIFNPDDATWWDGYSPMKEFDCFVVENITYKTMKSKKDGHLFGLAVSPSADTLTDSKLKYYEFK